MSSLPWISHHLFVAAAVQENNPGSKTNRDMIPPSIAGEGAVVEGFPEKWNRFSGQRETARLLSASGMGGAGS